MNNVVGAARPDEAARKPLFGLLRDDAYRFDWKPEEPAADPNDWNALR